MKSKTMDELNERAETDKNDELLQLQRMNADACFRHRRAIEDYEHAVVVENEARQRMFQTEREIQHYRQQIAEMKKRVTNDQQNS